MDMHTSQRATPGGAVHAITRIHTQSIPPPQALRCSRTSGNPRPPSQPATTTPPSPSPHTSLVGCSAAGLPPTDGSFAWPDDGSCDGATAGGNCTGLCSSLVGFQPGQGGAPTAVCNLDGMWSLACGACIEQGGGLPTGKCLCSDSPSLCLSFSLSCTHTNTPCLTLSIFTHTGVKPRLGITRAPPSTSRSPAPCLNTQPTPCPCLHAGCAGPPSDASDGFNWPQECDGIPAGDTCEATCAANFGPDCKPPIAVCLPDGSWNVLPGGACRPSECRPAKCAAPGARQ